MRNTTFLVLISALSFSCTNAAPTAEEQCEDLSAALERCYPDLSTGTTCSQEVIDRYDGSDFDSMTCEAIDDAGKADSFGGGGFCGVGYHSCGFIFCCYHNLTWEPSEGDWDIVDLVDTFQDAMPGDVAATLDGLTRDDLLDVHSLTYEQDVDDGLHGGPQNLVVEHTQGLIQVSLEDFLARIPADRWGTELDHYLGGEVQAYGNDAEGRVERQVERMVLSPLPIDAHTPANADMTKVERIVYTQDLVTVYWRVMHSDNQSTITDVGSVSFARYSDTETLVVFHSAHKLAFLGDAFPNFLVSDSLSSFFTDHLRNYRRVLQ